MELPLYNQLLYLGDSAAYRAEQFARLAKQAEQLASGDSWYLGSSDIAGVGVFASVDLKKDQLIGPVMGGEQQDEDGSKFRNLTTLARYSNHLPDAESNTTVRENEAGVVDLIAKRDINADEELTCDYSTVSQQLGFGVGMRYGSEKMPIVDLSTFKQTHGSDTENT